MPTKRVFFCSFLSFVFIFTGAISHKCKITARNIFNFFTGFNSLNRANTAKGPPCQGGLGEGNVRLTVQTIVVWHDSEIGLFVGGCEL